MYKKTVLYARDSSPKQDAMGQKLELLRWTAANRADPNIQDANGKMSFNCFHDSCGGNGWQLLMEAIGEPDGDY